MMELKNSGSSAALSVIVTDCLKSIQSSPQVTAKMNEEHLFEL
jgi:hypothetical protein